MDSHPYANLEAMREVENVPTPAPSTMDDPAFQHLMVTVNDLQHQIQLDREESRRRDDNSREFIQTLMRQINLTPVPIAETSSLQPTAKSAKLRDPEPFTGNPAKLFSFLMDCRLKSKMEPQYFTTEFSKIGWASTHLSGTAKAWWTTKFSASLNGNNPPELDSFEVFAAKLNAHFGDPDLIRTKSKELRALRQTTSVAQCSTEFIAISQFLDWNDPPLKDQFELGLKPDVKDALAFQPIAPGTLQESIDIANKIDIRLHQRRREVRNSPHVLHVPATRTALKPRSWRQPAPQRPAPQPRSWVQPAIPHQGPLSQRKSATPPVVSDGTTPMEIDASGRKVLPTSEKQRRFDNNLCMYCGDSNHRVSTCPRLARVNTLFPPAFITEIDSSDTGSTNGSTQE
jgi:hypothetical protein